MDADEQAPSAGRIRYYATDGTLLRVVEDNDIDGVIAPGQAVIDLAPAYREAMPRLLEAHSHPSAFHVREMARARERIRRWNHQETTRDR
jgi:predicted amidohydrolase YtcJ